MPHTTVWTRASNRRRDRPSLTHPVAYPSKVRLYQRRELINSLAALVLVSVWDPVRGFHSVLLELQWCAGLGGYSGIVQIKKLSAVLSHKAANSTPPVRLCWRWSSSSAADYILLFKMFRKNKRFLLKQALDASSPSAALRSRPSPIHSANNNNNNGTRDSSRHQI